MLNDIRNTFRFLLRERLLAAAVLATLGIGIGINAAQGRFEVLANRNDLLPGCRAFEAHVAAIPLGRMGDPDRDIAPVLLFLLSDASRYITGQIIAIDGGNVPVR